MGKYNYRHKNKNIRIYLRIASLITVIVGIIFIAYTFFPLISWQIYFAPAFASQKIDSPIPQHFVISTGNITSLISSATNHVNSDYTNAYNWYPGFEKSEKYTVDYTISIPSINLEDLLVSNKDADLTRHLVQFNSDTYPPKQGNSILFGHSTLPQLFNRNDYKTIFANAFKVKTGDQIIVKINGKTHNYKVESITVVEPEDTTPLAQNFTDSFLTIITCTPPGTIWKRLIIKARIQDF